ncbi:MAG: hypothetical protein A2Y20_09700 [Firmicutes bacterium GWF2_51_9]|nr:DUF2156 domain-containing protein [Erysipelotrichaceae bacterium]OGS53131.1 MAG: hypothetical protein A2Y20_09700 [Firmicutes bacterium GWF2_51_9]OGS57967.1 MAG: hypothetical protein A2Y19_06970 [Firmicutes bacterium GWE2_51_13]HAM62785.1 hypothetical protein [Erysipelotrichaceae bacterium]HBZ40761.1 hypothetical protein [Erysipelotrichaceae bacterium]
MDANALDFEPVTEEDCPKILDYLYRSGIEESNHNIVNMFQWRRQYPLWKYATDDYLLLLGIHKGTLFMYMPLCAPEKFCAAILKGKEIFETAHVPFELSCYTKEGVEKVLKVLPDTKFVDERDAFDYVYEAEKLRTFSGKKLQKRRNHINAFHKDYEGRFVYEAIDETNLDDVRAFLYSWKSDEDQDEYFKYEKQGAMDILDCYSKIPWEGGLIRIDGHVRAFVIGSMSSHRMVQINIEKADDSYRGLYQVVEKEFLNHHFPQATLVNREDDMGNEHLRAAKMALAPAYFIEKYRLREQHETLQSIGYR